MKTRTNNGAEITLETKDSPAVAPSTSCSGFVVVLRYGGTFFKSCSNPDHARGIRADEVWIFGSPQRSWERELYRTVLPMLAWIEDKSLIHRIPNDEPMRGQPLK